MRSISELQRSFLRHLNPTATATPARQPTPTASAPVDTFEPARGRGPEGVTATAQASTASTAEAIVADAYRGLLLREPDPAGLASWSGFVKEQLARGASPQDAAAALEGQIRQSGEFAAIDAVQQSFQSVLGRTPEGRGYWHDVALQMQAEGKGIGEIRAHLEHAHRTSDEYRLGHLDQMVGNLYRDLLMREPDPSGMQTWMAEAERMKAAGMGPADIEAVLSGRLRQSDEYQTLQVVDRVFEEELGRTPDAKGTWHELALQMRGEGRSHAEIDEAIRNGVRGSEEWAQKHPPPAPPPASTWVGRVPEINQLGPAGNDGNYWNGSSNCGPASLAMVARAVGWGGHLTDSQLVMEMFSRAGTTGDGTGVQAMASAAQSIGLNAQIGWNTTNVDQIAADLRAGKMVIANGDFYALGTPDRSNNRDSGHYVVIEGLDEGGNFIVNEPWGGQQYHVSPAQLRQYLAEWPGGSAGHTISVWP